MKVNREPGNGIVLNDPRCQIVCGDMLEYLKTLEADSVDACVTDPPYEIGFMGKGWDSAGVSFSPETWGAVLRILKPGAHLIAFGGTRTYHRIACAIEDSGFEIRDGLMWVYGQGFPKSYNVSKAIDKMKGVKRKRIPGGIAAKTGCTQSKEGGYLPGQAIDSTPITPEAIAWDGWGTGLKPAWESIILARKPFVGTVAANVLKHGTGAINVDATRLRCAGESPTAKRRKHGYTPNTEKAAASQAKGQLRDRTDPATKSAPHPSDALGRWPANVILQHSPECVCVGTREVGSGKAYERTGERKHHPHDFVGGCDERHEFSYGTETGELWACVPGCPVRMIDEQSGGASRFFYTAKASTDERSLGLPFSRRSMHPTVKPLSLMRYLVRLVTPPDGIVLDPFAGSGTTGVAAVAEGFRTLLVERDAGSAEDCAFRCRVALKLGSGVSGAKRFKLRRSAFKARQKGV